MAHGRVKVKSGQQPFYIMTKRRAATRAQSRRARPGKGRGRRTWLNEWPRGGNQPQSGNGGQAPRYMQHRIGQRI